MDIPFSDPTFATPSLFTGPGGDADEADASGPYLFSRMDQGDVAAVQKMAAPEVVANKGAAAELPAMLPREDRIPAMFLITGQWGPPSKKLWDRPITVKNPPDFLPRGGQWLYKHPTTGQALGFFDRMRLLLVELDRMSKKCVAYKRKYGSGQTSIDEIAKYTRAVQWVLAQEGAARLGHASVLAMGKKSAKAKPTLLPFGGVARWGFVSAKGNKKLPFASYSAAPMATCPGAGACGVYPVRPGAKTGYCYSFKAWKNPTAYSMQFLNTLAHYADREFAILAGSGGKDIPVEDYWGRFEAAISPAGRAVRAWPSFIAGQVVAAVRKNLKSGQRSFARLFVDGDIDTEDSIIEWMHQIRRTTASGIASEFGYAGGGYVEWYGYTKCWSQFVNVDEWYAQRGEVWPDNYSVNMSSASIYAQRDPYAAKSDADKKGDAIRRDVQHKMESLPIQRGYFTAIDTSTYIKSLEGVYDRQKRSLKVLQPSKQQMADGVVLSGEEITFYIRANELLRSPADASVEQTAKHIFEGAASVMGQLGLGGAIEIPKAKTVDEFVESVRRKVFSAFLSRVLERRSSLQAVRQQLWKDYGAKKESEYLREIEKSDREQIKKLVGEGVSEAAALRQRAYTEKRVHSKALSLALHDVFVAVGKGGSCPLVCGNCSDSQDPNLPGMHRCASKTTYKDRVIHIGLH
jgi:hypothetical protein